MQETKVAQYYDGLTFWNGATAQFRTTEDKASALQGYRAAGISFDEAAFEDHLVSVVNETLMMRLISTGGPLFLVSTPNGMNDYFDIVESVREAQDEPEPMVWVNGTSVLAWSVIEDNVGYGITREEVDRMEVSLDPATKEQQLRGAFLEPAEAFFTPQGPILSAFKTSLPEESRPRPGRRYVIFWDVSVASDPTAVIVIDVTKKPWRGVYFRHYPRPMGVLQLVGEMSRLHMDYNGAEDPRRMLPKSNAVTGYDATSMGGVIIRQLVAGIRPSRGLNFGGPDKKLKSLTNLRAALSKGDIELPSKWTRVRQEVLNYRLKDTKIAQDCVMALDGAAEVASGFTGMTSAPFRVGARITPRRA